MPTRTPRSRGAGRWGRVGPCGPGPTPSFLIGPISFRRGWPRHPALGATKTTRRARICMGKTKNVLAATGRLVRTARNPGRLWYQRRALGGAVGAVNVAPKPAVGRCFRALWAPGRGAGAPQAGAPVCQRPQRPQAARPGARGRAQPVAGRMGRRANVLVGRHSAHGGARSLPRTRGRAAQTPA